jgi:hypothetical protein
MIVASRIFGLGFVYIQMLADAVVCTAQSEPFRCFCPVAGMFQLKIHRAKVLPRVVRVRNIGYFLQCSVWLQLCLNFV